MKWTYSFLVVLFSSTLFAQMKLAMPAEEGVVVTFESTATSLSYERPLEGTITFITDANEHPQPQALTQALRGFHHVDSFEVSSLTANGKRTTVWRYRLYPEGMGPWRLDPFVLLLKHEQSQALREVLVAGTTFPSPTALPSSEGAPSFEGDAEAIPFRWVDAWAWLKGHWLWIVGLIACLAIGASTYWWLPPLRRYLKERSLPPEKRAKIEFERLQQQHLLEQGQVRRYFYELTAVVRRYFERVYHLRATRQTTEEFLHQLHERLPFDVATWEPMQEFLKAADYVKFAGQQTPIEVAQAATKDAHAVVDEDVLRRRETSYKAAEV